MTGQSAESGSNGGAAIRRRGVGFLEVAISLVCYLGLSIAAGVVLFALGFDLTSQGTVVTLWLLFVAATAPLVGVGLALLPRVRSMAAVGLRGASGRWLLIGAGVGLLAWLINRGVVVLYVWITGDASNPQAGMSDTATGGSAGQFALLVLLGGLIAPFGEELLFRGTLYTWLRRWGVVLATVVSAGVFGLFHGVNVVLPAAVVLGVMCALLLERSGSILPAVIAHAVNNALIFVLARVAAELEASRL